MYLLKKITSNRVVEVLKSKLMAVGLLGVALAALWLCSSIGEDCGGALLLVVIGVYALFAK